MKNIFKLTGTGLLVTLIFLGCQKPTMENAKLPPSNEISSFKTSKGSKLRSRLEVLRKSGRLRKGKPITDFNTVTDLSKNARLSRASNGCGKFKTITTSYPTFGYDESAVVVYEANNRIDYIDYTYSDDPSFNGRMDFIWGLGPTLTITYTWTDGQVSESTDNLTLTPQGYAWSWEHDLTNYYFDEPYTEHMRYNAQGFTVNVFTTVGGVAFSDEDIVYTKENNFESITDKISGNVVTYTNDLSKPQKIPLAGGDFWPDYTQLYGKNNSNYWSELVRKDKDGNVLFTVNLERKFTDDGYLSEVIRKEDGVVMVIYKDITYDCKNYNVSQPRSYK